MQFNELVYDFYNATLIVVYHIDRQSDTVNFKVSLILMESNLGCMLHEAFTTYIYVILLLCSF